MKKFKKLWVLLSLLSVGMQGIGLYAAQNEPQEAPKLMSLCPRDLSPVINGCPIEEEPMLFQQWKYTVSKLAPVLCEGGAPSVFISHAWHMNGKGQPVHEQSTPQEASYYDQIDLQLASILKTAGFDVHYDKDQTNSNGISEGGAKLFRERKVRESDVILSVCTSLYNLRSVRPSGVKIEVARIKDRLIESLTVGFYIPLLVSWDQSCDPKNLLVGQDLERMNQAIYLDLRNKSTFMSNMWQVFHRLWNNIKIKWKDHPNFNHLTQNYVTILGELLSIDDYYDHTGQPIPSYMKDRLKDKHNTLRIFTAPLKHIEPGDIINLIKRETQTHQALFNASNGQNIVVFLGNTGAGKSTLINFLGGKEFKIDHHGQGYELIDLNDPTTLKIGNGADSETLYPQWIPVDVEGEHLLFFDLPGFNDTDGTIRNLMNSAFIYKIIKGAASTRFVFVAGQDEVAAGRVFNIKKLFNAMQRAFTSPAVIENSSLFIMTKSMFKFQDRARALDFVSDKMKSASEKSFQNQVDVWKDRNRLLHMPHPQFDDQSTQQSIKKFLSAAYSSLSHKPQARFDPLNRALMVNSIRQIQQATREEIQGFNISGFYSLEVNLPLQNMFFHVMEEGLKKIQNQQHPVLKEQWNLFLQEKEGDLFPDKICDLTVAEYDAEIKEHENLKEIQLLKEVCQDPYKQAVQDFNDRYKKHKEYIEKYVGQLKSCQPIRRFLGGVLIYKKGEPDEIQLPISALINPLESTFDLSKCGKTGKYLRISTGYRKGKIEANHNKSQVWIVPKFVVEKDVGGSASHYTDIIDKWTAPIGIFYTDSEWQDLSWYDYLVTSSPDIISEKDLFENWRQVAYHGSAQTQPRRARAAYYANFTFKF